METVDVANIDEATIASHENLLLGTSTWGAGEMQDDPLILCWPRRTDAALIVGIADPSPLLIMSDVCIPPTNPKTANETKIDFWNFVTCFISIAPRLSLCLKYT